MANVMFNNSFPWYSAYNLPLHVIKYLFVGKNFENISRNYASSNNLQKAVPFARNVDKIIRGTKPIIITHITKEKPFCNFAKPIWDCFIKFVWRFL